VTLYNSRTKLHDISLAATCVYRLPRTPSASHAYSLPYLTLPDAWILRRAGISHYLATYQCVVPRLLPPVAGDLPHVLHRLAPRLLAPHHVFLPDHRTPPVLLPHHRFSTRRTAVAAAAPRVLDLSLRNERRLVTPARTTLAHC